MEKSSIWTIVSNYFMEKYNIIYITSRRILSYRETKNQIFLLKIW